MLRILVTGSRDWNDAFRLHRALDALECPSNVTLVHGDCPTGADRMAAERAKALGWNVEPHPAPWKEFGKRAGFLRNEHMVNLGADICVAFIMPCRKAEHADQPQHPSHGTDHCKNLAKQAGITVLEVYG